jgi:hypothetical protein
MLGEEFYLETVHITRRPDGSYLIVASSGEYGFAATSTVRTEQQLRVALKYFGFKDPSVEGTLVELRRSGDASLRL